MPQNYRNCQTLHRFSCVLTAFSIHSSRENKGSQTAQTLGSHIYSTNVDIPRLLHDISRFLMRFLDKTYCSRNIEHARFVYIFGSSNVKPEDAQIVFLIIHWLSIRSFGRRVKGTSIFILTVPRRYFCCGSLLFLLSVFILWFIYYVNDIFCKF